MIESNTWCITYSSLIHSTQSKKTLCTGFLMYCRMFSQSSSQKNPDRSEKMFPLMILCVKILCISLQTDCQPQQSSPWLYSRTPARIRAIPLGERGEGGEEGGGVTVFGENDSTIKKSHARNREKFSKHKMIEKLLTIHNVEQFDIHTVHHTSNYQCLCLTLAHIIRNDAGISCGKILQV